MESRAPPGKIQVTERVQNRLHDVYRLEPRGQIEVKGKGGMTAYLLLERRGDRGEATPRAVEGGAAPTGQA